MTDPTPKPEHPRPQFFRPAWLNLNGEWQFEVDTADSGLQRGLRTRDLSGTILVPYAPESEASGIGNTDFLEAVWYRRTVTVPADWSGRRVVLHFGAVDHDATVWVNDVEVVRHRGGFSSFETDITDAVGEGPEATIVVRPATRTSVLRPAASRPASTPTTTASTPARQASGSVDRIDSQEGS